MCIDGKVADNIYAMQVIAGQGPTTLQGSKLGMVRKGQQLMGISPQEVQLQDGGGRCSGQHIPHGVVLWDGLGLACQPDVPPVAYLWGLHSCPRSSQGVPLITRNTTHHTRGRLTVKCHWLSKSATVRCKMHWIQNATTGQKVPPPEKSSRLAAESVFAPSTTSVPQSASENATTYHQGPAPISRNLRSDCARSQQRSCRRHNVFLQVFCLR